MARICNFPISQDKRCKQPIADGRPNCGRHHCDLSAQQLGQSSIIYEKDDELHVWADKPDNPYCLIHGDPAYQALHQLFREALPCCLQKAIIKEDEHGRLHCDDGPARIWPNGDQAWYRHGELHRDGGPAEVGLDGSQVWCQHGEWHREDGPAWIRTDGAQEWYQHNKRHREDGPARIRADGTREWYQYGKRHREDGPAVINVSGTLEWWWHDEVHREDGPAVIWPGGKRDWYWHGEAVTEEEHAKLREQSGGV